MGDTRPGQGDQGKKQGGKPSKFEEQNKHTEERKAGENPRQGQPAQEPRKENADTGTSTTEHKK